MRGVDHAEARAVGAAGRVDDEFDGERSLDAILHEIRRILRRRTRGIPLHLAVDLGVDVDLAAGQRVDVGKVDRGCRVALTPKTNALAVVASDLEPGAFGEL